MLVRFKPKHVRVVEELAAYNEMHVKPFPTWPEHPYSYEILEREGARALKLTRGQLTTFLDGEEQEAARLVSRYRLHNLHKFLNDVFNGDIDILI